MVEQWDRDAGTVEHRMWNSRSSYGGRVEHMMVEQWNMSQWNRGGETGEHLIVEQWNIR